MTYVKTNFKREQDFEAVGSYNSSADVSGYVIVTHYIGKAPSVAHGKVMDMTAAAIVPRVVETKGMQATAVTFMVRSGAANISSASVHLIWHASL